MQNLASRAAKAAAAALVGGSSSTADCRARAPAPDSSPEFLEHNKNDDKKSTSADEDADLHNDDDEGFEVVRRSTSTPAPLDPPAADEVNEAMDVVLQHIPAAAAAAAAFGEAGGGGENNDGENLSLVAPSGNNGNANANERVLEWISGSGSDTSSSPPSSQGGAAAHMRDADVALAAAARQQQQEQQGERTGPQRLFRDTLAGLLADDGVRSACMRALGRDPAIARLLLRAEQGAGGGGERARGTGGEGEGDDLSAADLLPAAARAAVAAQQRGINEEDGENARNINSTGNNGGGINFNDFAATFVDPVASAVADALSSTKNVVVEGLAAAFALALEAGVHVVCWTRALGRLASGETWGDGPERFGAGTTRSRANERSDALLSFPIFSSSSNPRSRSSRRRTTPSSVQGWIRLMAEIACAVIAVIVVRRRMASGGRPR